MISPYVVLTWGVGDTDTALIIAVTYTFLALLTIYVSFRSNRMRAHKNNFK